ncbi:MAG TPA: Ig-like domain repeat protein, partial [Tahibacter sp.]|nr:Ig-like domain repeat protein [Tahibacter sp.]
SGTLSNTATVAAPGGVTDPTPGNNSATDTDTLAASADLAITKTDGVTSATPGGSVTYTITASNAGPSNATGSTVADTFPATQTCTWTCVGAGGGTCTAAGSGNIADTVNLPAGGSSTYTASCAISASATGSMSNTATVAAPAGVTDPTPGNNSATDTDTLTALADLTIAKSHAGNFTQGQTGATYTLTTSNVGGSPTSGAVTVMDTLPAGLTATAISGVGWTCTLGTLTCTRSDALAAGGSYPAITLTVNVAGNAPASVTNTAAVSGGGQTNTANDTASDPTTITQLSDLTIAKTHVGSFAQGQTGAIYTITANNAGAGPTSGTVTVTDTLPTGLTATAIGGTGWTCTMGTLTCTRSDALAAGSSYPVIALIVNVASNAPTSVTNTATVSGGGQTNTTNDSVSDPTTITQLSDLTITKTHTGSFTQGQTGALYTLTANNAGAGPTSGAVTVTDALPTGLTATAIGGTGWTCTLGTLSCTRSDALAGGSSYPAITLAVNVANNAPGSVTNIATVSGGGQINTANDNASDATTITPVSDLAITKMHVGTFTQGQTGAVYTIVANNAGAGPTSGTVTVTDTLPSGLTATAISGTGWTCTLGTLTCTRSDALAAGSGYPAITLTVNVANNAPASVTNTATISGGGQINTANDSANDTTTIAAAVYTIGGNVGGATSAATLTLTDSTNGTSQATSSNGAFTFATPLPIGASWSVTVTTPPSGQSCAVANGSGTNLSANVTNVQVTCAAVLVTITPATLAAATFSVSYSEQLAASSSDSLDHTPYVFTLVSGSLPTGLTLATDGLLSGTPSVVGSFPITVQAAGSGGISGTQAYTLVVNRKTTTVTVTATPNPTTQGVPVNLVATVAVGTPTGTVSFSADGATLPCSPVTLVVGTTSSTATCTTTFTSAGAHPVTASYSGDANFEPSTSAILAVMVDMPAVPVPALDRWALLLLCGMLGTLVFVRSRRTT